MHSFWIIAAIVICYILVADKLRNKSLKTSGPKKNGVTVSKVLAWILLIAIVSWTAFWIWFGIVFDGVLF